METPNKDILDSFTLENVPDLDVVTLGALELLASVDVPQVDFNMYTRPLVVGSGNAAVTGKIIFADNDAVFADESSVEEKLQSIKSIDGAYLISASGSKHADGIAQLIKDYSLDVQLLTNNEAAPAKELIGEEHTHTFPKNREPYTYNTSTYMGMILSKTKEKPVELYDFINSHVMNTVPENLADYDAYYLLVPDHMNPVREMFATKFDELFGPKLMGRIFTKEQTKHAKTVIPMESELFISFGVSNEHYGLPQNRLSIPLPENASYAAMMAIGYYVIGQIQKGKPPMFKERVAEYTREISEVFGKEITPIVE